MMRWASKDLLHSPDVCADDPPCAIHSPSDPERAELPWEVDARTGLLYRHVNGRWQPDPDSVAWLERQRRLQIDASPETVARNRKALGLED